MLKNWGLAPFSKVFEEKEGLTPEDAVSRFYNENSLKQIKKYIDPNFKPFQEISKAKVRENVANSLKADGVTHNLTFTYYDTK